jgi:hypothetical protein
MSSVACVQYLLIPCLFLGLTQNQSCGKGKTVSSTKHPSVEATSGAATKEPQSHPNEFSSSVLPPDVWGGLHVNLEVSISGASLDFDCAQGTISQAISLDAAGNFEVAGSYTASKPGPTRQGDQSQANVRYSGKVSHDTMTLAVRRTKSNEDLGNFTLIRGKQGKVTKCY